MILKKRKREKMGVKQPTVIRCPGHLVFVRKHVCSVNAAHQTECQGDIEAAHVRIGTDGGIGLKPSDSFTLPLCSHHHHLQHQIGETSFESRYKLSMLGIAAQFWKLSPAGQKYRREHEQQ